MLAGTGRFGRLNDRFLRLIFAGPFSSSFPTLQPSPVVTQRNLPSTSPTSITTARSPFVAVPPPSRLTVNSFTMLSSHRASRRHYPEEDDELPLTVTRIDDHRDTHPHSHHHSSRSEMYIASSSTARANYHEPEPSARGYRADDWRTRDSVAYPSSSHDRYHETTYNHHPRREDYYERQESRQVEHWPSRNEQHYTSSNRDWQKHTDHEYVSVSYTESRRSWRYGDNETYEHWSNTQEPPRRERERARYEREEDYGPQTTQETHGWRRDSGWRDDDHKSGWVERTDDRSSTRQTTEYRATEDRTWEPAPSWKGREKEPASQPQRVENRHNRSSKKAMKSGKRIHGGKRTDRRKDDSHMNK